MTPEDSILTPTFKKLWEGIIEHEKQLSLLSDFSADDYKEGMAKVDDLTALITKLENTEKVLLHDLVGLLKHVKHALQSSGENPNLELMVDIFKPFMVAKTLIESPHTAFNWHYALVSHHTDRGGDPKLKNVVHIVTFEGRVYKQMELVHDLLQFWEFILRNQTSLKCADFCLACRTYLRSRVSMTIFQDALSNFVPSQKITTTTASAVMHAADIDRRLKKITRRLAEMNRRRRVLHTFTGIDLDPKSPRHKLLSDATNTYHDEQSLILSELVHLKDNVTKWLKASTISLKELDIIEKMIPFRVASCFVNTEKHGIRAKNKTALFELDATIFNRQGPQPASSDGILDQLAIINYDGKPWQTSTLIDDLLILWELFLRNHTTINTTDLCAEIARLLAEKLVEYRWEISPHIESYLDQKAKERKKLG